MARFYQAPQGAFSNFIYQPNMELQLALADKEVQLDATKKAFASQAEYDTRPTFMAWQEDLDKSVEGLNEKVDALVPKILEDPNNKNYNREFRNLTNEARELYSSGDIGMMTRHYAGYQDRIKQIDEMATKIKDPHEKTAFLAAQKKWRNYVGQQAKDYKGRFKEFSYNDFVSPMDSQKYLQETIDPEKMKAEFSRYLRGEMPDGEKRLFLERFPELAHTYGYTKLTDEAYQTDLIMKSAKNNLLNNDAFREMMRQNYFSFGERMKGDDQTSAEGFQRFMEKHAEIQAANYASKFTGKKHDEDMKVIKDEVNMAKAKAANKKAIENPMDIFVSHMTQDAFTEEELLPAMKTFLNKLPMYNNPDEVAKWSDTEKEQFKNLQQAFGPVLKGLDYKDLKDIGNYIPMLEKVKADSPFYDGQYEDNEEIYSNLAGEIRQIDRFKKIKKRVEPSLKIGSKIEKGKTVDPIKELFRTDFTIHRDYPEFTEEDIGNFRNNVTTRINHIEGFEDLSDKDKDLLAEIVVQKMENLQNAYTLYNNIKDESSQLRKDIEEKAIVNTPYISVGAETPLGERTAQLLSQLKGNSFDVHNLNTTVTDWKGEYREPEPLEDNENPLVRIQNRFGTSSMHELINNDEVHAQLRPLGSGDIEMILSYRNDNNKEEGVKIVYKDVETDFWDQMIPYTDGLKNPEAYDMVMRASSDSYVNLSDQVRKRTASLSTGGSGLGPVKGTALSNKYRNEIRVMPGYENAKDSDKKYTLIWHSRDQEGKFVEYPGLTEAQVSYTLYNEGSMANIIANKMK